MNNLLDQDVYTVSRLNQQVNLLLNSQIGRIWLVGEISNFSMPSSGHWYFSLKDRNAQVKCAMFKGKNINVQIQPKVGDQVLVRAQLSLYEPRGDYQLIIDSMQADGDGLIQQQFEALKAKLMAEGLFDSSLKQKLPEHPKSIGIISSLSGAALQDILHVLRRRAPSIPIVIYPAQVQGTAAPKTLIDALVTANLRHECDVIILGRGGGSQEDLSCFNDEALARTIAMSQIPIISAVGHEIDFTISDFVADLRAPTPSVAAELVSEYIPELNKLFEARYYHLQQSLQSRLNRDKQLLQDYQLQLKVHDPQHKLKQKMQRMDELSMRLQRRARQILLDKAQRLQLLTQQLNLLSPLATISRGYSITRTSTGELLKHLEQVKEGDIIETQLENGVVKSRVLN